MRLLHAVSPSPAQTDGKESWKFFFFGFLRAVIGRIFDERSLVSELCSRVSRASVLQCLPVKLLFAEAANCDGIYA